MAGLIITLLANVCALHVFSVINYYTVWELRQNRSKTFRAADILQCGGGSWRRVLQLWLYMTNKIPHGLFLLAASITDNIQSFES